MGLGRWTAQSLFLCFSTAPAAPAVWLLQLVLDGVFHVLSLQDQSLDLGPEPPELPDPQNSLLHPLQQIS